MAAFPYKFHLLFWNILVPVLLFVLGDTSVDFLPRARVYCLGHWVQCWNSIFTVMLLLLSSGKDWKCFEYRSRGSERRCFGRNGIINVTWSVWMAFAVGVWDWKWGWNLQNSCGMFICPRDRNKGGRTWLWSTDLRVQSCFCFGVQIFRVIWFLCLSPQHITLDLLNKTLWSPEISLTGSKLSPTLSSSL
jgi:hypothetical protein